MHAFSWFACLLWLVSGCRDTGQLPGRSDAPTTVSNVPSGQRSPVATREATNRMITLLKSDDFYLQLRAIRVLGPQVRDDAVVRKAVARYLFSKDFLGEYNLVNVAESLASANAQGTPEIVDAFEASVHPDRLERLLMVISRMRLAGIGAAPILLQEMNKPDLEPELRGKIRVVLANIGYESEINGKLIENMIEAGSAEGMAAVWMIAMTGGGDWAGDAVVRALGKSLDNVSWNADTVAEIAMALGTLGRRAAPAAERLGRLFDDTLKDKGNSSLWIISGFALASVEDAPQRKKTLRKLMESMADGYGNHTDIAAVLLIEHSMTPDMWQEIMSGLDEKDPKMVKGSVLFHVYVSDPRTELAASRLLRVLAENSDEDVRRGCALALRLVGSDPDISRLAALLKKEKSESVCDEIKATIEFLEKLRDTR